MSFYRNKKLLHHHVSILVQITQWAGFFKVACWFSCEIRKWLITLLALWKTSSNKRLPTPLTPQVFLLCYKQTKLPASYLFYVAPEKESSVAKKQVKRLHLVWGANMASPECTGQPFKGLRSDQHRLRVYIQGVKELAAHTGRQEAEWSHNRKWSGKGLGPEDKALVTYFQARIASDISRPSNNLSPKSQSLTHQGHSLHDLISL